MQQESHHQNLKSICLVFEQLSEFKFLSEWYFKDSSLVTLFSTFTFEMKWNRCSKGTVASSAKLNSIKFVYIMRKDGNFVDRIISLGVYLLFFLPTKSLLPVLAHLDETLGLLQKPIFSPLFWLFEIQIFSPATWIGRTRIQSDANFSIFLQEYWQTADWLALYFYRATNNA